MAFEVAKPLLALGIPLLQGYGMTESSPVIACNSLADNDPRIPSTIEAAALCKMADRHQIKGGILDGPLALDNAISLQSAKVKHIDSRVAGNADILLVPDLEAGNMLAKELSYLSGAEAAGIVLGSRVPIVLTSRADGLRARVASCAVAMLYGRSALESSLSCSPSRQSSSSLPAPGARHNERK
jgi:phosphate acetyltransferase